MTISDLILCNIILSVMGYRNVNLQQSDFYQKALSIFKLSRRVASYVTDDKDVISMYRSGNVADNYADNIVMNAFRLVPKVAEVEAVESKSKRLHLAKSLQYVIELLYQDCKKLEGSKIQGKDFVRMLRKELKKLRYIHKHYMRSLV